MIIRDPVHKLIDFGGPAQLIVEELLDAVEVQRLRRIRQLGMASLAFPGAEHSRFGHSLGAAFVMVRLCERLIRHSGINGIIDDQLLAAATAAALLHDVGHPPLSHLTESALAQGPKHEKRSIEVVSSQETQVGRALARHGIQDDVAQLLAGTHQARFLCDAISSPLDVDRFDYLLRDSHHTGVSYGVFDLDWMLSSLMLAEAPTPSGLKVVLAVDGRRGLRAVEGYLMARLSMFQQVYFHKTGRAAEFMFKQALKRAGALRAQGMGAMAPVHPVVGRLLAGEIPPISEYLELDDNVMWSSLREWSTSKDPVLSRLSSGLLRRGLLRTLPLARALDEPEQAASVLDRVRQATAEAGYDPDYFCGLDRAVDVPYHVDPGSSERIWVVGLGKPGPLAEVSPIVDVLRRWQVGRTLVICPKEARDALLGEMG